MTSPTVLTLTKRIAELCGTQVLLHTAGFGMMTATNMASARSVLQSVDVSGVIVCRHSWSDQERDAICAEINQLREGMPIMRCPGCDSSDMTSSTAGKLLHISPLVDLITEIELKRG